MRLRELAHSRTGDKGTLLTISLIAYKPGDYGRLVQAATAERVSQLFKDRIVGPVTRYEVPGLWALNFVLQRHATQSVTRSLSLDAHGKTLGSLLLELEICE